MHYMLDSLFFSQIESVSLRPTFLHPSIYTQTLQQRVLKSHVYMQRAGAGAAAAAEEETGVIRYYLSSLLPGFFSAAPDPALWQQWRFSKEAMFYVSALTVR